MRQEEKFAVIDEYGRHALLDERGLVRPEYAGISHLVFSLEAYARTGACAGCVSGCGS